MTDTTFTLKDGSQVADPRLDRLTPTQFDPRNRAWPARALLTEKELKRPRSFTWAVKHWLDQLLEGRCVEFAICHELLARPVAVRRAVVDAILHDRAIYWPAQREDEWEGGSYPGAEPHYEGTSVHAGMRVAARLGFFSEYRWCFGIEDLGMVLGYKGPVVLGINWYRGMSDPDEEGFIHPTGPLDGGHAITAHGVKIHWKKGSGWTWWARTWADVDLDRSYVWLWNSWGPEWGIAGRAKISLRDLERLLHEQGEAAVPVRRQHGGAPWGSSSRTSRRSLRGARGRRPRSGSPAYRRATSSRGRRPASTPSAGTSPSTPRPATSMRSPRPLRRARLSSSS